MRLGIALAVAAAGCRQLLGFDPAVVPDSGIDVIDGPDATDIVCAGSPAGLTGELCFTAPTGVLQLTDDFDTTNDPRCDATFATGCAVIGDSVVINNLNVSGSRPLVVWSASTLTVVGPLDAGSSILVPKIGPGANSLLCANVDGLEISMIGSGGGGGSYAGFGRRGGTGRTNNMVVPSVNRGPMLPAALRGGCRGGVGGDSPETGGSSGGVVYLIAATSITVTSTITVAGAAGLGGTSNASTDGGGGGGGSGGLIGLDSPTIVLQDLAVLSALGGGGGAGASSGSAGNPGKDGDVSPPLSGASGGASTAQSNGGGTGGGVLGGAGVDGGDVIAAVIAGGGGGGGGPGYIIGFGALSSSSQVTTAPPIMLP